MIGTVKKLLVGASVVASFGAIASTPAFAGTLTGATIGGSNSTDYLVYDVSGTKTVVVPNTPANVQKVLDGNAASPTGNVELAASSEKGGFDFTKNTTLTGKIGGLDLTLSSLTETDWFGTTSGLNKVYGAATLATKWFNEFITKAGYGGLVGSSLATGFYNNFFSIGGFQASSDPNISYVNQDDTTGLISIGLAGHYDLKAAYASSPKYASFASLLPNGFQASEVVKYTYNGKTDYLYSFKATNSGLTAVDDGISHSGNYEVYIKGDPTTKSVPEPSAMLGVMAVGGMLIVNRKREKKA